MIKLTNKDTMKDEAKQALNTLMTDLMINPDELETFIKNWTKGFRNYSLCNIMLICIQCDNPTLIAGSGKWKKHGRYVKKGEKSIRIYAPLIYTKEDKETGKKYSILKGYRLVPVFDISQTQGKDIDNDKFGCSDYVTGVFNHSITDINKVFDYELIIKDNFAGNFSNGSTNGQYIKVVKKSNKASEFCTYIHEIAHAELGHCEHRKSKVVDNSKLPRNIKEIQAETVSFIVSTYYGIKDDKSKFYIASWQGDKKTLAPYSDLLIKTAWSIISKINKAID